MKSFRKTHVINILEEFSESDIPLDLLLNRYFRSNKAIGSKDRKEIVETIYKLIRWRGLIEYLCEKPLTWDKRIETCITLEPKEYLDDENIPLNIRLSFPKPYFTSLIDSLGVDKTIEYCLATNESAPVTIRVNTLKISREELFKKWEDRFDISYCDVSPVGIRFNKRENLFGLEEFKLGYFEMQDEASQICSMLVKPIGKDHVLDYCSGSGGKTLGFAPYLDGKGQIYLHDIRKSALYQAKKRLKRAGIENAQVLTSDKLPKREMDWILLDVPCTGSGTLRRNPDQKWKFKSEWLTNLQTLQREIFSKAIKKLKKSGKIVYATCSVFPSENTQQINYFIDKYDLEIESTFQSFPQSGKMDGFFACILKRKQLTT